MASQVKYSLNIYLQNKSHILYTWTKQDGSVGNPSDLGAGFEPKPTHGLLCLRGLHSPSTLISGHYFNPLLMKLHLSDLKTQSVPRSKHSPPRL